MPDLDCKCSLYFHYYETLEVCLAQGMIITSNIAHA